MALLMFEVNMKVRGLWSVQIVKGRPSKKYLKCFTARKMAINSRSNVDHFF